MKKLRTPITTFLAILMILALGACGPSVVRGQSPFVKVNGLKLNENTVELDLGVRNVNEVLLEVESMDFVLEVRDLALVRYDAPRSVSVIANGSESLHFELPVSKAGQELLAQLQSGEIDSLPYTLEGRLRAADEDGLKFSGGGHLYPVPGRPGQFR